MNSTNSYLSCLNNLPLAAKRNSLNRTQTSYSYNAISVWRILERNWTSYRLNSVKPSWCGQSRKLISKLCKRWWKRWWRLATTSAQGRRYVVTRNKTRFTGDFRKRLSFLHVCCWYRRFPGRQTRQPWTGMPRHVSGQVFGDATARTRSSLEASKRHVVRKWLCFCDFPRFLLTALKNRQSLYHWCSIFSKSKADDRTNGY